MAVYYPEILTVVAGTQVQVRGVVNIPALYNSVMDNTYHIIGMQLYIPNRIKAMQPMYFNIKDADGNFRKEVIDRVITPDQLQNTLVADIEAEIDINNYISTIIQAGGTMQFKLYHATDESGSMFLRKKTNQDIIGNINNN